MAIRNLCSDGSYVTEDTIKNKYSLSLREKHGGMTVFVCEGCGGRAVHNDHTIAKARCKKIHKTELIWHPGNFVNSCEKCHKEWENLKSAKWLDHKNAAERMLFMKQHDYEGFVIRMELTELAIYEREKESNASGNSELLAQ